MTWTIERTETLERMWAEGYSASEIAKKLGGVTRNAVIAKVHRMRLGGRAAPSSFSAKARPAAKALSAAKPVGAPMTQRPPVPKAPARPPRVVLAPPAVATASLNVSILDRALNQCAFSTGQNARGEYVFCGHPVRQGSSYCAHHHGVVYTPAPPRKRKSASDLDAIEAIRRRSVAACRG